MSVEETKKYIKLCRFWYTLNSLPLPLLKPRWTNISGVVSDSEKQTEESRRCYYKGVTKELERICFWLDCYLSEINYPNC